MFWQSLWRKKSLSADDDEDNTRCTRSAMMTSVYMSPRALSFILS
jgi:hypothetical protein